MMIYDLCQGTRRCVVNPVDNPSVTYDVVQHTSRAPVRGPHPLTRTVSQGIFSCHKEAKSERLVL